MGEGEEAWASKASLITLLDTKWKKLNYDALVEFLNTFVIKGLKFILGRKA